MAIFSASEYDKQWKEEFLTFLEGTIDEQKQEIYTLHSQIYEKSLLTSEDKCQISEELCTIINELLTFDNFFSKIFPFRVNNLSD